MLTKLLLSDLSKTARERSPMLTRAARETAAKLKMAEWVDKLKEIATLREQLRVTLEGRRLWSSEGQRELTILLNGFFRVMDESDTFPGWSKESRIRAVYGPKFDLDYHLKWGDQAKNMNTLLSLLTEAKKSFLYEELLSDVPWIEEFPSGSMSASARELRASTYWRDDHTRTVATLWSMRDRLLSFRSSV